MTFKTGRTLSTDESMCMWQAAKTLLYVNTEFKNNLKGY